MGPGIAWGISKVQYEIADACPDCGEQLGLQLKLHGAAQQEVAEGVGRVIELRKGHQE